MKIQTLQHSYNNFYPMFSAKYRNSAKEMSWYIEEQSPIYLDNNATTPLASEVEKSIVDSLRLWANPSSNNGNAMLAKKAIEEARSSLATLFGVTPKEVIFTSGGTEANNWVIHHAVNVFRKQFPGEKPHVVTSEIEHPSILEPLDHLVAEGVIELTKLPIEKNTGMIACALAEAMKPNTCLVTIMMANNETGVMQSMECVADVVHRYSAKIGRHVFAHTDAAQAVGKVPVNLSEMRLDAVTVVGHKFYGPRIGALILRSHYTVEMTPLFYGGGQERGLRSGTENTPMIVGLGTAAKIISENSEEIFEKLADIRDYFESELDTHLGDAFIVNFQNSPRLPNTSSVSFPTIPFNGCELLEKCKSFHASTGAACHTGKVSAVLTACGLSHDQASRTIRFSFGRETTHEEVDRVIKELKAMIFFSKHGGSLLKAMGAGPGSGF